MKHPLLVSLALAAGLIAPVTAQTPVAPPTPTASERPINHAGGRVMAVNGGAITVESRRNAAPITFTLAPDVKVHLVVPGLLSYLAVGNLVRVDGKISDDAKTVAARNIAVLAALPTEHGKPGRHPRHIVGTLATLTPALTVTAQDGSTVTVTTTAGTRVEKVTDGNAGDIAVGVHADARLSGPNTALVAREVNVSPERPRGGGRRGGKR